MIDKFYYNEEVFEWQRIDRVQEYKGVKIETITAHPDYNDPLKIRNHREYRLTYKDGRTSYFRINKRGGNIKNIKDYLDFKAKYNEI